MPQLPHLKSFLLAGALTALTLSPAWAQEKFKVITTFTVIADNRPYRPLSAGEAHHQKYRENDVAGAGASRG